jgi:hypothetical protein
MGLFWPLRCIIGVVKQKNDIGFINQVSEDEIVTALKIMESSSNYLTKPNYRGTSERWTDNYVSFVEYHMNYLRIHPSLNPEQYISNLRLILRNCPR